MAQIVIWSPVGPLTLTAEGPALSSIRFGDAGEGASSPVLEQAAAELAEYFAGKRRAFSVPLAPQGTAFQRKVWATLEKVPYGETASYGQIAAKIGNPKASRAVGMANNRNPVPILIPCHRIVGADGALVGYGGGLEVKRALLDLEKRVKRKDLTNPENGLQ